MNLNQLWSGNDYAYYEMRGRGEQYRSNARRVKIIRGFQKRQYGNERLSGFAEVYFLHDDGTPIYIEKWDSNTKEYVVTDEPKRGEVRARDIAKHWDEYSDEREHREAERVERQRRQEEEAAREAAMRTKILDAIVEKFGIPRDIVTSIDEYAVRISRPGLEKELGINA